jgi:hypothetical protein
MDSLLDNRYRLLFQSYGSGETGIVAFLKARIIDWNRQNRGRLRWDAALFLLTNLDQLIARPYSGFILDERGNIVPLPGEIAGDDWSNRTQQAADLVLQHLRVIPTEISAHDVLQAIESNWETLSKLFGWW